MTIELFGLPGSGKTTCAKSLASSGVKIITVSRFESLILQLPFLIFHPKSFFGWFFLFLKNAPNVTYAIKMISGVFITRNAKFLKAQFHATSEVVVDEGILQNTLSCFSKPVSEAQLRKALSLTPKSDRVIVLDPQGEDVVIRMRQKNQKNMNGAEVADERFFAMQANFDTVKELLDEEGISNDVRS